MIVEVIRGLNMGGAETLLYTRLRYATTHRVAAFEATLVVNTLAQNDHYTSAIRGLGIDVVELRHPGPIRGAIELRRLLAGLDEGPTIVFHSPVTTYLEKLVRMFHFRPHPRALIDVVHSTWYRRAYRLLGRLFDRRSDLAIAVGEDVAASPAARHYVKSQVILAGVDVERMRDWVERNTEAPRTMKQAAGIDPSKPLIIAVGSLIPLKGHRHIIEALARTDLKDTELVLVGEGPERMSLERLATELGVSDRVHLLGRVDEGWRWTAIADAIVHPSHFEGLPVAMMEAAALGTPIVATQVGGMAQIVTDDSVGRLIPSPDAGRIAGAVREVLNAAEPIVEAFAARAGNSTFWSMERYATEFYDLCAGIGKR